MKKLLALILAAALALSLVACGGGGAGDNNTPSTGNGDTTSTDTPSGGDSSALEESTEPDCLQIGDTFKNEKYEITVTDFEFGKYLENSIGPVGEINMDFMRPIDEYKPQNVYNAESGNIMVSVTYEYKYIGKEESNHVPSWTIDYNDGYIFEAREYSEVDSIGWSDIQGYIPVKPLEKDAHIIRMCFEVPEEVETNTDAQLLLNFYDCSYKIR